MNGSVEFILEVGLLLYNHRAAGTWAKLQPQSKSKCVSIPKRVSVTWGRSYPGELCSSVHFYDQFGFNQFYDALKMGCGVIIERWTLLATESGGCTGTEIWCCGSTTWSLQCRLTSLVVFVCVLKSWQCFEHLWTREVVMYVGSIWCWMCLLKWLKK